MNHVGIGERTWNTCMNSYLSKKTKKGGGGGGNINMEILNAYPYKNIIIKFIVAYLEEGDRDFMVENGM